MFTQNIGENVKTEQEQTIDKTFNVMDERLVGFHENLQKRADVRMSLLHVLAVIKTVILVACS